MGLAQQLDPAQPAWIQVPTQCFCGVAPVGTIGKQAQRRCVPSPCWKEAKAMNVNHPILVKCSKETLITVAGVLGFHFICEAL